MAVTRARCCRLVCRREAMRGGRSDALCPARSARGRVGPARILEVALGRVFDARDPGVDRVATLIERGSLLFVFWRAAVRASWISGPSR